MKKAEGSVSRPPVFPTLPYGSLLFSFLNLFSAFQWYLHTHTYVFLPIFTYSYALPWNLCC